MPEALLLTNPRLPAGAIGHVIDTPVTGLDLVPTIAELAGVPASAFDRRGYGRSDRPTLPGISLVDMVCKHGHPQTTRDDHATRPVLVEMDEDGSPGPMTRMRTIVRGRHKLTIYSGLHEGLLLADAPHETVNRWSDAKYRGVRADLLAALAGELARTDRLDARRISGA